MNVRTIYSVGKFHEHFGLKYFMKYLETFHDVFK